MIFHPDIEAPYYAVIFPNQGSDDTVGYESMANLMQELAEQQSGFLGIDSTRNVEGYGITVSYWKDEASILSWKQQVDHRGAQMLGRERWYRDYHVHIARVEREYSKENSEFI